VGHVVRWGLFLGVLAFVIGALAGQFAQVDWTTLRIGWAGVAFCALCLLGVPVVQMASYRALLGSYTRPPDWRAMAAIAWVPPMGKYVPGKVASILGAVYLLRRFNITSAVALSVVLAMDGIAVLTGLIIGAPLLTWEPVERIVPMGWLWCAIVVALGCIALYPRIYGRLINTALHLLRRPTLPRVPDLKHYLVPVICMTIQWILAGLSLWFVCGAVAEVQTGQIPVMIAVAALGYTISYLALFAPGGLGVREAVFAACLSLMVVPPAHAAIAVVLVRIIQTLTEATAALAGWMLLPRD
jgi:uncharacterized membrane protein YbhN (UPF0104 family)